MAGLVESIQSDALNQSIKIATLLRKVKLAAAKLQLPQVAEWVDLELNGYSDAPVPEYRKVVGRPRARNPYHGWIPIQGDPQVMEVISSVTLVQSVAAMEQLTQGEGQIHVPMSPREIAFINEHSDIAFGDMTVFLDRTQVITILETVRTKVLDWAIELEKQGILGEGMSFDKKEVDQAKQLGSTISIGSIANFTGNLGQGQTSGAISAHQVTNEAEIFDKLAEALCNGVGNKQEQERLVESVKEMSKVRSKIAPYAVAYGKFIELAANHMSIVAPFLPALGSYLK